MEEFEIGDTFADFENPEALPTIAVDEPTMSMLFTINDSPFFGKEGKFVTSRHIKERLERELEKNLALRVQETDKADRFIVVINKVDKENCRPDEVHDAVFELFFNLDATEDQLNFPAFYGSGRNGWFNDSLTPCEDITPLMDGILKYVPGPDVKEGPTQMQITSLD